MIRTALAIALAAAAALGLARRQDVAPARAPTMGEARAAVAANHQKFTGAFARRDAAAAAALHASDARLLPENGRAVEGAQAVEAFWRAAMESGVRLVQLQTLSVEERGDLAYETGDYMTTVPTAPGVTDVRSGNYLAVWRREGGDWKVAAAIWNRGESPAGP
jgi:ketosteroid isomerase-like protein